MSRPRVKICGITRREDADLAVHLGADLIGFVFWPRSPRVIGTAAAAAIAHAMPPGVLRVGVFVDQTPEDVAAVVRDAGLDVVQLHGDEDVADFKGVGARIFKAMPLRADQDVLDACSLPPDVMPLVDAFDRERRGGTGQRARWDQAAALADTRPVILAGGLTADNIREALATVRPWGVDVSSGVEASPGIKNATRMIEFFAAVRAQVGEVA